MCRLDGTIGGPTSFAFIRGILTNKGPIFIEFSCVDIAVFVKTSLVIAVQLDCACQRCTATLHRFVVFPKNIEQSVSIGLGKGLAPNRWQDIAWTNDDKAHRCTDVSLGFRDLTNKIVKPFTCSVVLLETEYVISFWWLYAKET